jgi:predicted phosphoadenosine phosphosulfate sulfurtransferase
MGEVWEVMDYRKCPSNNIYNIQYKASIMNQAMSQAFGEPMTILLVTTIYKATL